MNSSVKDMLSAANGAVPRLSPEEAARKLGSGDVLIVDVREPAEVEQSGRIRGAVNVPRGLLEFRADPDSPLHDAEFRKDRTVAVYCASGGRSALAAKTLRDMGFGSVFNIGGFKELAEAGLDTEPG